MNIDREALLLNLVGRLEDRSKPAEPANGRTDIGKCWIWTGPLVGGGGGQPALSVLNKFRFPRRALWALQHPEDSAADTNDIDGAVELKMSVFVGNVCDSPLCVNPAHVTKMDESEYKEWMRRRRLSVESERKIQPPDPTAQAVRDALWAWTHPEDAQGRAGVRRVMVKSGVYVISSDRNPKGTDPAKLRKVDRKGYELWVRGIRGSKDSKRSLTAEKAREIREYVADQIRRHGDWNPREAMSRFGVKRPTLYQVLSHVHYRDVGGPKIVGRGKNRIVKM